MNNHETHPSPQHHEPNMNNHEIQLQPEQHITINHEIQPTSPEQHINTNHTDPPNPSSNHQTTLSRTSSETTQQNNRDRWKLDSIKNGIIVLCSLFASFCFGAILSPPGGVWQDNQSHDNFLNMTLASQISNQSVTNKYVRAFVQISQLGGKIPKLNLTNPEIFTQGKAMNIVMYPREFLYFLGWNSLCYVTSLVTVGLVMLTTSFESFFPGGLVLIMTSLVVVSAFNLYWSVLVMVSDKEFGYWAGSVGGSPLRFALLLFCIYQAYENRVAWLETLGVVAGFVGVVILGVLGLLWGILLLIWKSGEKIVKCVKWIF